MADFCLNKFDTDCVCYFVKGHLWFFASIIFVAVFVFRRIFLRRFFVAGIYDRRILRRTRLLTFVLRRSRNRKADCDCYR